MTEQDAGAREQRLARWRSCAVLHVDMDMFYVGVELLAAPHLRGRPVVVAAAGHRSVVLSASYEARAYGVRSGMPLARARALCPAAVLLEPHRQAYEQVSRRVMATFAELTDLVEQISVDEAFLDVSGAVRRLGPPVGIARGLRARIRAELGLTASVGIGATKTVAKIASTRAKPDGLLLVQPEDTVAFLAELPVSALWGVGARTAEVLTGAGLRTVGDLAAVPVPRLARLVGPAAGHHLHELASGHDPRPVVPAREEKSLGAEETFAQDVADTRVLHETLLRLSHRTASRLRRQGLRARRVGLKLRWADFSTITRSRTLAQPFTSAHDLHEHGTALLAELGRRPQAVRLIGIRAERLEPAGDALQLSLDGREEEWGAAEEAMDRVHARFGPGRLGPARLLRPAGTRGAPGAGPAAPAPGASPGRPGPNSQGVDSRVRDANSPPDGLSW
ncbi:DNA polymerase IV [Kocuria flava]|uniref:DNA polymerase IV n=1 Tax=Kocuria flava TaxID=446860 RepID=A0A2N4T464_9MICC|nr:DNA polymerase IV [Kocuria flava]PLC13017.1 DNA polymerase IV [Kocuria flava]